MQSGKTKIQLNGQLNSTLTEMSGDGSVKYSGFSADGTFDLNKLA